MMGDWLTTGAKLRAVELRAAEAVGRAEALEAERDAYKLASEVRAEVAAIADELRSERDAARAEVKALRGQKYIDYHVVTKDGDVVSDVLRFLPDAESARAVCDKTWPDEAPHRIQSRVVTYAEWADHET